MQLFRIRLMTAQQTNLIWIRTQFNRKKTKHITISAPAPCHSGCELWLDPDTDQASFFPATGSGHGTWGWWCQDQCPTLKSFVTIENLFYSLTFCPWERTLQSDCHLFCPFLPIILSFDWNEYEHLKLRTFFLIIFQFTWIWASIPVWRYLWPLPPSLHQQSWRLFFQEPYTPWDLRYSGYFREPHSL